MCIIVAGENGYELQFRDYNYILSSITHGKEGGRSMNGLIFIPEFTLCSRSRIFGFR